MSDVNVRAATDGDAGAIADVAAATFALACPPHTTQESIAAFIAEHLTPQRFAEYLADRGRALVVAEQEGAMVGYAMLVHGEPYDADVRAAVKHQPTTELSKLYVLPAGHGSGVARELMAAVIEAARSAGAVGMWLGTNQRNERAHRFYEKTGFERIGTKRFKVGDRWEDDYIFELAIG